MLGPVPPPPAVGTAAAAPTMATLEVATDHSAEVTVALSLAPAADVVREEPVLPILPGGGVHTLSSPTWSDLERSRGAQDQTTGEATENRMSPELAQAHALVSALLSPPRGGVLEATRREEEPLLVGRDVPVMDLAPSGEDKTRVAEQGVPLSQERRWSCV